MRFVHEDVDRHGNVRIYFWRGKGHKKIRIRERPGTAEFRRAYNAALTGQTETIASKTKPLTTNTFRWLCVQYFGSAEFKQLDPRTQRVRRGIIEHCLKESIAPDAKEIFADFPLDRINSRAIRVLRDRKAEMPEGANNRVKALRQVFKWGKEAFPEMILLNPAKEVPYLKPKNVEGFHSWTIEEVQQFENFHPIGTKARLALALFLYTGQRRSDIVLLGKQHIRNERLEFTQFKRRNIKPIRLSIPILPELQDIIDRTPTGDLTFLVTEYGKPFTSNGFGGWFRKRCNEAGLNHCSAHGLRKATASRLAEGGASSREIMSITGHQTSKEVDRYTKAADQKRLANNAIGLLKKV